MTKFTLKALFLTSCLILFLGISPSSISIKQDKSLSEKLPTIQNSLTLKKKPTSSTPILKNSVRKITSPCQFKNYPPPPEDKSKPPTPIWCYVEAIADLCKIDSYEEQLRSMEVILEGLRDVVSFYRNKYRFQVGTKYTSSLMSNLIDDAHMRFVWKPMLARQHRMDVAGQFLLVHSDLYNAPEAAKEDIVLLVHDWAEPIYRGLYCLSTGSRTQERIIIYKD